MKRQYKDTIEDTNLVGVDRFDEDVRQTGSYLYTADRLSARYANERISLAVSKIYDFRNSSVIDVGCGDGLYALNFAKLGAHAVVGIDPAPAAIEAAINRSATQMGKCDIRFQVGNVYDLQQDLKSLRFRCAILRGTLHHLPDPELAIKIAGGIADNVIIVEPNGYNPALKLIERWSRYHRDHDERSYAPMTIRKWCRLAGLSIITDAYINLVPMFCPDWLAKLCKIAEAAVETIPLVRNVTCGQYVLLAESRN